MVETRGNQEKAKGKNKELPEKIAATAMDKLTYLLRETGDQMIHLVITYEGHINFPILKKAMEQSFIAEPILGCKFVEHPRKPYWIQINQQEWENYCQLINSRNFEKELFEFVTEEFDGTKDLPVKICIFRQTNRDQLCLKVTHTAMDGAGMLEYMQLLDKLYQELLKNPHFKAQPNLRGSRGLEQVLKHFKLQKKTRVFWQYKSPKPGWAFPWVDTKQTGRTFIVRRLPEERFQRIKQYGKERKATINDILLAAFYRAFAKLTNAPYGERMVNVVTVNLRTYLEAKRAEAICNLSASIYPYLAIEKNELFKKTLHKIQEAMNRFKENLPGIGSAFFVNNLFGRLPFRRLKKLTQKLIKKHLETKKTHPIFTNVGLVKKDQLTLGKLQPTDAYLITPIMFAPGFIFGMMTFEKKMSFSIGFCEGSYSRESVEQFLDYFIEELPR
ncbi:MAG: condensation domain-containing protein [Candidatus Heimdallarchaeota archaeon]